jgi:bleomycin hydrolase
MFCALVDKYGCVPKAAMPETFHSSNTRTLNKLLTLKLREDANALRAAHKNGERLEALEDIKDGMLKEIYGLLCICLGEPPKTFTFEYRGEDKQYHADADITPKAFFDKYVGQTLDEYISVINAPTEDKPYYQTYTVPYLGNVVGGRDIKYLNLPSEELKRLAVAQLKDGKPVWFGCDVGQMLTRESGIMGMHTFDYELLTGMKFALNKAERLDYSESVLTHAMVFTGVNLKDDRPTRWKVENSWGEKAGQEGYYIMTDEWFDEYNYQVVVEKKYLSEAQAAAYAQEPVVLQPWDPMGSLA